MNIQIERANIKYLEQVENIEKTLEHRILSYDSLLSSLDSNNYYYFVVKVDNAVIGYIAAEFLVDHFDLLAIAVLKEYRRQNIASLLLDKLFTVSSELNIENIFLEVRASNLNAIRFYEKFGFEKISIRKNYYSDTKENAIIYSKKMV